MIIFSLCFILILCISGIYEANAKGNHLSPIYQSLYNRNYPDVITQAERLKARYPNDDTLYYLQGYAYLKNNNETLALGCFSKSISLNRNKGDVHFWRAVMYHRSGRDKEALDDINRAIRDKNTPVQLGELDKLRGYKPDTKFHHPRMYFFRAAVNKSLGRYTAAMSDINQAIHLSPVPNPIHFKDRGDINFLTHKFALARNDYQKAVQLDPTMINAWCPLGQCDLYLGNYTRAIANLKKTVELNPEYPGALRDLGLAYALNGDHNKALESMGRALRTTPDGTVFYHLAYVHHLKGNQTQALKNYKKAQKLAPDILGTGAAIFNITPKSSPIKKFYRGEFDTARLYLETGKTPAAIANEKRKPSLQIIELSILPNPVPVNTPFDILIDFKSYIPGGKSEIPTRFDFTISRNNDRLYKSEPFNINAKNSKISSWTHHMNPVPATGVYLIKAYIRHNQLVAEKSMELIIK